jgi:phosphoribosylaminoimidazole-succinocarboxamide synthase
LNTLEQHKLELLYEGSVKRVFQCPWQEDSLLFQFTDDYSIFDWGKMPDSIVNKGRALTLFGASVFMCLADSGFWQEMASASRSSGRFDPDFLGKVFDSQAMKSLLKHGLGSHFQGLVDSAGNCLSLEKAAALKGEVYMKVGKAEVARPQDLAVLGQRVFYYPDGKGSTRLVPLEVVFRFGMPSGSSLTERLRRDPSYAGVLGLKSAPREGEMFDRPVIEFFSKLEPKDRLLSVQEALLISGLNGDQFSDLVERAQLIALACFYLFAQVGIELWDGKLEFILHDGSVELADSIGPDELRLLYAGTHLSKEMIRRVYRATPWEKSLKEAQKLAGERCTTDWKAICLAEMNSSPEPLPQNVKAVVNRLYGAVTNTLTGSKLFSDHPGLAEFVDAAKANGL